SDFVIDASGSRGFLVRALGRGEKSLPGLPPTQALFSHFDNVASFSDRISNLTAIPPYPPEQAAVHHVFPGGWMRVLRFNNGITSAGVASTDTVAEQFEFKSGAMVWERLLQRLPSVAGVFRDAHPIRPFIHVPPLAFQSNIVAGSRWALLPSAAGFVDPLLSTGFPLTLLGVTRLGRLLRLNWNKP